MAEEKFLDFCSGFKKNHVDRQQVTRRERLIRENIPSLFCSANQEFFLTNFPQRMSGAQHCDWTNAIIGPDISPLLSRICSGCPQMRTLVIRGFLKK